MKVLCIETPSDEVIHPLLKGSKKPIALDTYTIHSTQIHDKKPFYVLEEIGLISCWDADLFIPLSDIDETVIKAKRTKNEDVYVYDLTKDNTTESQK